jgi:hypothetical protein
MKVGPIKALDLALRSPAKAAMAKAVDAGSGKSEIRELISPSCMRRFLLHHLRRVELVPWTGVLAIEIAKLVSLA